VTVAVPGGETDGEAAYRGRAGACADALKVGVVVFQPVTPTGPAPGVPDGSKKTATIVLSVLVAVLALAAGLFLFLFLSEKGATADTNSQITNTEQQIRDQKGKLADAKSETTDLQDKGQDLQGTHDQLQACTDATKAALQALDKDDQAALTKAVDDMVGSCPRDLGAGGS
jgi:cell division protein FtsL